MARQDFSVLGLKLCTVLHNKQQEQTQLARVEAEAEEEKIKKRFVPKLKAISFHSFWQRAEGKLLNFRTHQFNSIYFMCMLCLCVCVCVYWLG